MKMNKINKWANEWATHLVVLNKGVSNVDASGLQEGENHATAKDELVDLQHENQMLFNIHSKILK